MLPTNESVPIQPSQDYQEGRDRYSPGRTDLQARSSERGAAAVGRRRGEGLRRGGSRAKGGFGGAGLDAHHQRGRRRAGGREPAAAGKAGKGCQRAELERVAEPLGIPVLNLT